MHDTPYKQLVRVRNGHDDVIKWKLSPRYWPFLRGIHQSPMSSPHKGQWRGALMLFYLRPNKRLSKQSWGCWFETSLGSLWRHSNINNVCIAITNCYALTQVLLWCSFHNNQNKANKHINNPPPKYIQNLLFSLLKYHVRSNKQGQYPGCWCPESLCCWDIISHDISYEQSWYYCFRCDWISRNCAWKNKKSCEIQIYFWSFLRNIQQDKI